MKKRNLSLITIFILLVSLIILGNGGCDRPCDSGELAKCDECQSCEASGLFQIEIECIYDSNLDGQTCDAGTDSGYNSPCIKDTCSAGTCVKDTGIATGSGTECTPINPDICKTYTCQGKICEETGVKCTNPQYAKCCKYTLSGISIANCVLTDGTTCCHSGYCIDPKICTSFGGDQDLFESWGCCDSNNILDCVGYTTD